MIKIKITRGDAKTDEGMIFTRLRLALSEQKLALIVDKIAFQALADIVRASPKKYFGQIRSGWRVVNLGPATKKIEIEPSAMTENGTSVASIAKFVNAGTANGGQGYIYPKRKKRLYIPLHRGAVVWHEGLVFGVDYILAKRVKGIKGRFFVEPVRRKARADLRKAIEDLIDGAKKRANKAISKGKAP